MGRFNPYLLTDWHRDHGAALVDPNRSLPIARYRKVSSVEATLVHVDNNATVVYGEEVKLDSIQNCPLELPAEVELLLGVRRLTGWLVYKEGRTYQNHDLVVTEFPATNLYFQGRLLPSIHRKKSQIVEEFRKALEKNGLTDPIRAISQGFSSLSFQPFESRNNVVSAWLIEPRRIEELSVTQRTRGSQIGPDETVKSSLRGNLDPEKAEWSLGICREIDRCIGLLEINEEKDRLFEQTENGDLFKNYPVGEKGRRPGSGPIYQLMRAIAVALRKDVYQTAIMTALGGIDESLYPSSPNGSPKPVMKQVKLLYHRLMYALVKRCDISDPVLGLSDMPSFGAVPSSAALRTLREKLEELREKIRPLGRDIFMAGLEKTVSEGDDTHKADETLAHLILAAPKEWSLPAKLVSWLRSYQPQFSKTVQAMIDERLRAQ